jgi:hypothetical protein
MALGYEWCCNSYGIISYYICPLSLSLGPLWTQDIMDLGSSLINKYKRIFELGQSLSEIQMASRDAYQKLCGLVAGSRSSGSMIRSILIRLARKKKMRKCTKNTAKFSKLLEVIRDLKIRLMDTNHYPDISNIDDRARKLYDIYFKEISNDHLIVVNDEGWKKRRAHGYLKHFYKQHQKGKK